jgi:WXG100 family type VII secretion target
MSSSHIKVSQQGLTNAITRIRSAKEEYDHALSVIESTIKSLDAVWNGKAQVAMREKFEEKRATFKQFGEEIESYATDMTAFRDEIAQRDQALASQIANNM